MFGSFVKALKLKRKSKELIEFDASELKKNADRKSVV